MISRQKFCYLIREIYCCSKSWRWFLLWSSFVHNSFYCVWNPDWFWSGSIDIWSWRVDSLWFRSAARHILISGYHNLICCWICIDIHARSPVTGTSHDECCHKEHEVKVSQMRFTKTSRSTPLWIMRDCVKSDTLEAWHIEMVMAGSSVIAEANTGECTGLQVYFL